MLIALLPDIHANREAFDGCLADARERSAERFVFLGDYVGYGADPAYVVDRVARMVEEGAVALLGNHDEAVFGSTDRMNPLAAAAIEWTRGWLDEAHVGFLRALPLSAEEGDRLFVHSNAYAPRGWGYVTDRLEAARSLAATRRRLTLCGHVHVPALFHTAPGRPIVEAVPAPEEPVDLSREGQWLAVIGAVGQPRDDDPRACYALLDDARNVLTYVRVDYDIDTAARKIMRAGLPPGLAQRLYIGR
jgi:diadenosine tetraphosphatase ApaH/serine/threonine PP2A family protein phosphatase